MKSKTSFFNRGLIKDDIHRLWPIVTTYILIYFLSLPLGIHEYMDYTRIDIPTNMRICSVVAQKMITIVWICIPMGLVLAMGLFAYLMKSQSTNMYHSFPIKRSTHFASHFLSGIIMFTFSNLIVFALSVGMEAYYGYVDWKGTLAWLLCAELVTLFSFGFATCCAMITGWLMAVPVICAGLNVVVAAFVVLLGCIQQVFYYGYYRQVLQNWVYALTPVVKIYTALCANYQFDESAEYSFNVLNEAAIPTAVIYGIVGLAFAALAYIFYRARKSETAGDAIVFNWIKPIAKFMISVIGGLGLGLLTATLFNGCNNMWILFIFVIVSGLLFLAVCNMMLAKSYRIFNKKLLKDFTILIAILLVIFIFTNMDVFGFQTRLPEADQVEYVQVQDGHMVDQCNIYDQAYAEKVILLQQTFVDRGPIDEDYLAGQVVITYVMKDGDVMYRAYDYTTEDDDAVLDEINDVINDPVLRKAATSTLLNEKERVIGGYYSDWYHDNSWQFSKEVAQELCDAIIMDIEQPNEIDVRNDPEYYPEVELQFEGDQYVWYQFRSYDENVRKVMEENNFMINWDELFESYGRAYANDCLS